MGLLSAQVAGYIEKSSWIRRMFEAGQELKEKYGPDNVFDFSLGNPDVPPPESVGHALQKSAAAAGKPLGFGYMPNAGFPDLRRALAEKISREEAIPVPADNLLLTCGAAGALNVFLRAVLEPGEEVVCPAPYFVEYGFYAQNHGGTLVPVPALEPDFRLDINALEASIGEKTRAVLLNSPNNPTGRIYTEEELDALAGVLAAKSEKSGRPVFLVSDEPYRFLSYDGRKVPSLLGRYPYSIVVNSFSKSLGLAGERIGYAAVSPEMPGGGELVGGMVLANRILGFVNAPVLGQKILLHSLESSVDTRVYARRREMLSRILDSAGLEYPRPEGGFYFFVRSPTGDDQDLIDALMDQNVLAVPGSGFGFPGYVRFAFCVPDKVISGSEQAVIRAAGSLRRD
ncbi:MAG: pyridoxal phosphate-dependent aminotransferase [Desulfonatronovibrionaceae bacterium]